MIRLGILLSVATFFAGKLPAADQLKPGEEEFGDEAS